MPRTAHVDTNVILRLLLGEPEAQARAAETLFTRAAQGELTVRVHPAVLAEVVYVLTSPRLAALPRARVASVLRELLGLEGVEVPDLEATLAALRYFEETSLDWVDCLLLGYATETPVYTFDEAMIRAGGWSAAEEAEGERP
ncbi:MAG: PIN domain-containing protein [Clostridia bacterium]|nr:PIN domain-containing protein [Clostridia bacterium]